MKGVIFLNCVKYLYLSTFDFSKMILSNNYILKMRGVWAGKRWNDFANKCLLYFGPNFSNFILASQQNLANLWQPGRNQTVLLQQGQKTQYSQQNTKLILYTVRDVLTDFAVCD